MNGLIPSGGMYCGRFEWVTVTVTVMKDETGWWTVTDEASFTGMVSLWTLSQAKPSNYLSFFSFPLANLCSKHKKYTRSLLAVCLLCPTNSIYLSTNEINETEGGIVTTRMCWLYAVAAFASLAYEQRENNEARRERDKLCVIL